MDFSIRFTFASNTLNCARENRAFPKYYLTANLTEPSCSIFSQAKCMLAVNRGPPFDPMPFDAIPGAFHPTTKMERVKNRFSGGN